MPRVLNLTDWAEARDGTESADLARNIVDGFWNMPVTEGTYQAMVDRLTRLIDAIRAAHIHDITEAGRIALSK